MSGKIMFPHQNADNNNFNNCPQIIKSSVDSKIPIPSSSPTSPTRSRLKYKNEIIKPSLSTSYLLRSASNNDDSYEKIIKITDNMKKPSSASKIFAQHHHQAGNRVSAATKLSSSSVGNFRQIAKDSYSSLKRGNSFMERGEKRANNNEADAACKNKLSTNIIRPNSVKICTENNKGAAPSESLQENSAPNSSKNDGNRIRSLSLSLSNSRISSPRSPNNLNVPSSSPSSSSNHRISPLSGILKKYSSTQLDSWDTDSITSIASSVASCDHASVARNGTTFSGRSMKYVFHCNQHANIAGEDYLTPTQRAHRQIKKLKQLLHQARKELEQKDSDILKLTKEVVELRLYKAALNSPEDKSNSSSDAVTVRENTSEDNTPSETGDTLLLLDANNEINSSFADSGHYEDGTNSSIHSNEDFIRSPSKINKSIDTCDKSCTAHIGGLFDKNSEQCKLIMEYEKRIQELVRTHEEETYHLKHKHNDKVEELLQRITEINARYWELVPELDTAKERIKELELQLEETSKKLQEQEEKSNKETYLDMYSQEGHQAGAARVERENDVMEMARQHPNRVSVPELLNELQVTKTELENIKDVEYASSSNQPLLSAKEALSLWVLGARKAMYRQLMEAKSRNKIDPEITLQFLKSAIYYFLTDKENSQGHLKAIQSILGFSINEIKNIDKLN